MICSHWSEAVCSVVLVCVLLDPSSHPHAPPHHRAVRRSAGVVQYSRVQKKFQQKEAARLHAHTHARGGWVGGRSGAAPEAKHAPRRAAPRRLLLQWIGQCYPCCLSLPLPPESARGGGGAQGTAGRRDRQGHGEGTGADSEVAAAGETNKGMAREQARPREVAAHRHGRGGGRRFTTSFTYAQVAIHR
uniref:Secreted protein n=1 Tax=Oryza sativa subsp. japonica TaxID=39947 RepID=Q6AVK8_ORYSJ|nr:predicted protein [Oryza sativa Japonica Group]